MSSLREAHGSLEVEDNPFAAKPRCARKAVELTPGDLLRVASATEAAERHPDRGAEVSRGHIRS